jgi:hypothetical protein
MTTEHDYEKLGILWGDPEVHLKQSANRLGFSESEHMTDAQILTLALAVILPLSMLIYSNSRISEAKETLRAEMQALRMELRAGFEKISSEIRETQHDLKVHELEHHHS